jgi:hypothetical protein
MQANFGLETTVQLTNQQIYDQAGTIFRNPFLSNEEILRQLHALTKTFCSQKEFTTFLFILQTEKPTLHTEYFEAFYSLPDRPLRQAPPFN